jgi:adenylate cyclase class 2
MREVELKAVCDDLATRRKKIEQSGATLTFEGRLVDRRYDIESRELTDRDEVLRVRRYESAASTKTYLDWKGSTETTGTYKIREEISTLVENASALEQLLARVGFVVTAEIDRQIAQYDLEGASIRFETYPRMDCLVEVEGEPDAIERAIEALGMARGEFTSDRLSNFVDRFEQRTGVRAALSASDAESHSEFRGSGA